MLAKNGMTFVFPKWSFGGMNNNNSLKTLAVIVLMLVFATGCTKPDTPNNGGNGSDQNDSIVEPNHGGDSIDNLTHDWVDLGLPSGTLWATCNVGADTPEGIGPGARPRRRICMIGRATNTAIGLSSNLK